MENLGLKINRCKIVLLLFLFTITAVFVTPSPLAAANSPEVTQLTLAEGSKYAAELYIIDSGVPGPVVMIVGGVHGNEPAGFTAARKYIDCNITRGTLLVLPKANKPAAQLDVRAIASDFDLNRSFPRSSVDQPDNALARAIWNVVKTYDVGWLMDMHEGYDYFNNKSTSSVGQSLIYYPDSSIRPIASRIVKKLNSGISGSYRDFHLGKYPIEGSLARSTAEYLGVHSFIFETCDNPSLSTRVKYQRKAANMFLESLNMI